MITIIRNIPEFPQIRVLKVIQDLYHQQQEFGGMLQYHFTGTMNAYSPMFCDPSNTHSGLGFPFKVTPASMRVSGKGCISG